MDQLFTRQTTTPYNKSRESGIKKSRPCKLGIESSHMLSRQLSPTHIQWWCHHWLLLRWLCLAKAKNRSFHYSFITLELQNHSRIINNSIRNRETSDYNVEKRKKEAVDRYLTKPLSALYRSTTHRHNV